MEEEASVMSNSISYHACVRLGVAPQFIDEWLNGVRLAGAEGMAPFHFDDYPTLKDNAEIAAKELDRLTLRQKIFWYPPGTAPTNLSVCPGNLILKGSRARVVQNWARAGLNQRFVIPEVNYGTMDSFLKLMKPRSFMAGLDFQDCFFHWKVHPESRRWLGLRHPISGNLGVFLFVPFGLGAAPGINDRNVAEVIRVAREHVGDINVTAFVDDLRLFNPTSLALDESSDHIVMTHKLIHFKEVCEELGMSVHKTWQVDLAIPVHNMAGLGYLVSHHVDHHATREGGERDQSGIRPAPSVSPRRTDESQRSDVHGFLNFIAAVFEQAQPFGRELGRCIVEAQVFQAWASGKRQFNPIISLSPLALSDLL